MTKPYRTPNHPAQDRQTTDDMGGIRFIEQSMQQATGKLCVECPLRRDSKPGFLGGYSADMYVRAMRSGASIACHMSPGFADGSQDISRQHHCTGVAAWRAHMGIIAQIYDIVTAAHRSTVKVGSGEQSVLDDSFSDEESFVKHHGVR